MTELSVIIVSHGHERMLPDCLSTLACALAAVSAEILVVDNLPDGRAERELAASFPNVRFIRNRRPQGLAENVNQAAALATGEYLLLLNPDTRWYSGSMASALDYLHAHTDVGILSCELLNSDGTPQRNFRRFPTFPVIVGRALAMDRWPFRPGYYRRQMMHDVILDEPAEVDWVFGAFMLINRQSFCYVGGMDANFRLYYEDVDLCYRLRQRGFRTVVYPDLRFTHLHLRASARRPLGQIWRWHLLSALRFLNKHRCWWRPALEPAKP
jgi:GT2 family glycosyltransferase